MNSDYDLYTLVKKNNIDKIRLLLKDPLVDPAADNNHLIRYASEKGKTEIVRLLLEDPRVNPSADTNYAIRLASQNGHTEVVKMLLEDSRVDPTAANHVKFVMKLEMNLKVYQVL